MATYIHGLDRESEPGGAALAKRMLDQIGGHWWNIYIGGPYFKGKGWSPAQVQDYVQHGIERFMLTYVGRQKGGTLTRTQGLADGRDARHLLQPGQPGLAARQGAVRLRLGGELAQPRQGGHGPAGGSSHA